MPRCWKTILECSSGRSQTVKNDRLRPPAKSRTRVAHTSRRLLSGCMRPFRVRNVQTCQSTARPRHPRRRFWHARSGLGHGNDAPLVSQAVGLVPQGGIAPLGLREVADGKEPGSHGQVSSDRGFFSRFTNFATVNAARAGVESMGGRAHAQQGTDCGYQVSNSIACGKGISRQLWRIHPLRIRKGRFSGIIPFGVSGSMNSTSKKQISPLALGSAKYERAESQSSGCALCGRPGSIFELRYPE
jgi:hypothetical protein